jgi:hypothetical protein
MGSLVHELFDRLLELRQHFGLGFLAGFYVFQTLFCIIDALRELLFQLRHPIDKTLKRREHALRPGAQLRVELRVDRRRRTPLLKFKAAVCALTHIKLARWPIRYRGETLKV